MADECAERLRLGFVERATLLKGFGDGPGIVHCQVHFTCDIDGMAMDICVLVTLCDISEADIVLAQKAIGAPGKALVV